MILEVDCRRCDLVQREPTPGLLLRVMSKTQSPSTRRRSRRLLAFAAVGIAVVAGILWTTRDQGSAPADPAPDVTLEYFDGSSQQLSELRGKPVVLNFWASWCPPCISEMPVFGDVHRRFADDVEFVGVNMQEVDVDAAMALADQTNVDYPLAHDRDGAIYGQFGGIAMPTTIFISADGSVERVHAGTILERDLVGVIEDELLG